MLDFAEPGDNEGLLLRGVEKKEIKRGHVLTKVGTQKATDKLEAVIYFSDTKYLNLQASEEDMEFRIRTALLSGSITVSKDSVNRDGQYAQATVELKEPVALNEGMVFAIKNVGIGKIIEVQ